MTDNPVVHSTFTLERHYLVAVERVFSAWSTPSAKAQWFAGEGSTHQLDFRVGGEETATGTSPEGHALLFRSHYHHIVADERIAYSSTLSANGEAVTLSVTTVEFRAEGTCTRLTLTESAAYLDGHEKPEWREQGTNKQLDALLLHLQPAKEKT